MMQKWHRNIRLILWIRICFSLIFSIPVIALYWKSYGMDLLDIFVLQAIFAVAILVLEVPTGWIGDRIGRKKTLLLAGGIAALGWGIYALANSFVQFVVVEIVLGMAFAFLSGTDTALLYESLKEARDEGACTKVMGRQLAFSQWAEGAAALAGGFAAVVVGIEALMAASAAACFVAFLLALGLQEPPREVYAHPRGTLYGLYKIARFIFLKSKLVRLVLPYMAACGLATMLGVWLYQPLWEQREIPLWAFGILWAGFSLPCGLAGHFAHAIERRIGPRLLVLLMPLPAVLGYVLIAFLPGWWAILPIYLVPLLRGLNHPVLSKYVHEETFSDKRATVFSVESWLFRLFYFALGPLVGWIARDFSLEHAFLVSAGLTLLLTLPLMPALWRRLPREPLPAVADCPCADFEDKA